MPHMPVTTSSQRPPFLPAEPPVPFLRAKWLITALGATIVIDAALLLWVGLRIDLSWAGIALIGGALAAAILYFICRDGATVAKQVARDLTESLSILAGISLLGAVASYPLAASPSALADPELEQIDTSLHFHWTSWYSIVADHPWLQAVERTAYLSIFVTPAILLAYFAVTRRKAESRLFLATFWVTAVLTLALFPLVPAAGPLATLWHGSLPYVPVSALYQTEVIHAMRHHAVHAVDLGGLRGLVCAPSFHAASAILFTATAWRIAPLRWPVAALNMVMLMATLVEGTHYLADVLAGVIVASFAIAVTPALIALTCSDTPARARSNRRT